VVHCFQGRKMLLFSAHFCLKPLEVQEPAIVSVQLDFEQIIR
jgi:hypothetical protein